MPEAKPCLQAAALDSNRSRRKRILVIVKELRNLLAQCFGCEPEDVVLCEFCDGFINEKEDCYLTENDGAMPPKRYCLSFALDLARDPRKGEVMERIRNLTAELHRLR